jgi:hypothetical protein
MFLVRTLHILHNIITILIRNNYIFSVYQVPIALTKKEIQVSEYLFD